MGEVLHEMNGYDGKFSVYSNTYIEWRFECMCKQLHNGDKIFVEWRNKKEQYISIMSTIEFDFQHYSRHDASHSICIIQRIEQILGKERVDMLSAGDLWLILQVAYSHDIGMALTHEELVKLWKEDENFKEYLESCLEEDMGDLHKAALFMREADNLIHKQPQMKGLEGKEEITFEDDWQILCARYLNILVAEYIRKRHAFRSKEKGDTLDSKKKPIIQSRLYDLVDEVNAMHARNFEDILTNLKYRTEGFGKEKIHPQFVAVMLRLGDLLDIDNNRFDPYFIEHFGRLPAASLVHKKKHEAITHICVSEDEISVEAQTDEYEVAVVSDSWFQYIDREVENLICYWNQLVPIELYGCRMKKSVCKTFFNNQLFDSSKTHEFSINKERLIDLLIGTSIYQSKMECIREYIQNALDALKVQLWIDLENGRYNSALFKNDTIFQNNQLSPFDLDKRVYENYQIVIEVGWNKETNKVSINFKDNGIGIEREYMEKLSTIGTGWHGRTQYQSHIHKMVKWLRPTGGFGIGMQSAFMVTDSVEIVTKSDKDVHGYRIVLEKEKKGTGTASIIESEKSILRGTSISYEISPEEFQSWSRWFAKRNENEIKYLGNRTDYGYSSETWDEFDEDGILHYAVRFLKNYVEAMVPNSFFPIVIKNSNMNDEIIYNIDWPNRNYWQDSSECIEVEYEGKEFLGFDVSNSTYLQKNKVNFLVWNKTDNIYMRIQRELPQYQICYKNVLVRDYGVPKSDLFFQYNICMDFMGFSVRDCLHLHRNSFIENFNPDVYMKECFRVYLYFLWEYYKKHSEKEITEQVILKNHWLKEWRGYDLQLIRVIGYPDIEVENMNIEDKEILVGKLEKKDGKLEFMENYENATVVLENIQQFYDFINTTDSGSLNNTQYSVLVSGDSINNRINLKDVRFRKNTVEQFLNKELKIEEEDSNILTVLHNLSHVGMLRDLDTIKMLQSDNRLSWKTFECRELNLNGYFLMLEKSMAEVSENEVVTRFWDVYADKRVMVEVKEVSKYKEIQVKVLPFSEEIKNATYIISPLSKMAIFNVEQVLQKGTFFDYEKFRQLAWGERGQESSSYNMLINWVLKNQIVNEYYTKEDIKDCYEKLLNDIYMEHIFPVCKKGK